MLLRHFCSYFRQKTDLETSILTKNDQNQPFNPIPVRGAESPSSGGFSTLAHLPATRVRALKLGEFSQPFIAHPVMLFFF